MNPDRPWTAQENKICLQQLYVPEHIFGTTPNLAYKGHGQIV